MTKLKFRSDIFKSSNKPIIYKFFYKFIYNLFHTFFHNIFSYIYRYLKICQPNVIKKIKTDYKRSF